MNVNDVQLVLLTGVVMWTTIGAGVALGVLSRIQLTALSGLGRLFAISVQLVVLIGCIIGWPIILVIRWVTCRPQGEE